MIKNADAIPVKIMVIFYVFSMYAMYRDDRMRPVFFIYIVHVFLDSSYQTSFRLTDTRRFTIFAIDFIYHITGGQPSKSSLFL